MHTWIVVLRYLFVVVGLLLMLADNGSGNKYSQNGQSLFKVKSSKRRQQQQQRRRQERKLANSCEPTDRDNVRILNFGDNRFASFTNQDAFPGPVVVKAQKRQDAGVDDDEEEEFEDAALHHVRHDSTQAFDLTHFDFLSNVLIIAEDKGRRPPIPAARGGKMVLTFLSSGVLVHSMRFVNTGMSGEKKSDVTLFGGANREKIRGFKIPYMRDGGQKVVTLCAPNVTAIEINLEGPGAIDDVVFSIPPPATPEERCCDVQDAAAAQMECPTMDGVENAGLVCCPDGSWSCVYSQFSQTFFTTCVDPNTGIAMRATGSDRFDLLFQSDLTTRTPLCGDGCNALDLDTILSLQLPCPSLCNSDRQACNDQETVVTRNPRDNCNFFNCPKVQCCNPLKQPRCFGDDLFCCADGQWICVARGDLFGPFCRGKLVGHEIPSPVCSQCNKEEDFMVCPNTTLVRRRDADRDCEFQPCPTDPPSQCCDPQNKPGDFGNPPCPPNSNPECCRTGNWECGAFSDFRVYETGQLFYFLTCDPNEGPIAEADGLVCGEEFDPTTDI